MQVHALAVAARAALSCSLLSEGPAPDAWARASHMAEETTTASHAVPYSIIAAVVGSAVSGFILIISMLFSVQARSPAKRLHALRSSSVRALGCTEAAQDLQNRCWHAAVRQGCTCATSVSLPALLTGQGCAGPCQSDLRQRCREYGCPAYRGRVCGAPLGRHRRHRRAVLLCWRHHAVPDQLCDRKLQVRWPVAGR